MTPEFDRGLPRIRIFMEGVVIVGSILPACGIDASWQERVDRGREKEILSGLEQDLIFNLDQIRGDIEKHVWHEERLVELEAARDEERATVSPDSSALYLRPLGVSYTFDSHDGKLDGVISAGNLDLIGNPRIRSGLLAWKQRLDDMEEETKALRALDSLLEERMTALGGPGEGAGLALLPSRRPLYAERLGSAAVHPTFARWGTTKP